MGIIQYIADNRIDVYDYISSGVRNYFHEIPTRISVMWCHLWREQANSKTQNKQMCYCILHQNNYTTFT